MPQKQKSKTRVVLAPRFEMMSKYQDYHFGNTTGHVRFDSPTFVRPFGIYESISSVSHKGPPFKEGGPFALKRFMFERSFRSIHAESSANQTLPDYNRIILDGAQCGYIASLETIPLDPSEADLKAKFESFSFPAQDLSTYGPTAINRFSPLNSGANLGQFIGELREGLPRIPLTMLSRLKSFKALGREYLNVEFGWKPFLKDLRDFYKTQQSLNDRLRQIIRDNNKPVVRTGKLKKTLDSTVPERVKLSGFYPPLYGYRDPSIYPFLDYGVRTVKTSEDIWFKGRFRYYIPDVTSDEWTTKAKLALFGLNPTPSILYQLMPWSWLIDWFSNVGDVIANLSSNGIADLVIDYGYIMRHHKVESQTVYFGNEWRANPYGSGASRDFVYPSYQLMNREVYETKERVAATPFGFGLQISDLTDRQLAILTALGLSRLNF